MATSIALSAKLLLHYHARGGRFNDSSQRLASPTTIKVTPSWSEAEQYKQLVQENKWEVSHKDTCPLSNSLFSFSHGASPVATWLTSPKSCGW